MSHYCSIPSVGSEDIWCLETKDGYFEMYGIRVNFCPFCGKRAPKVGVPEKWVAHTHDDLIGLESKLHADRSAYKKYSDTISST